MTMHLQVLGNAYNMQELKVIVSANAVNTYDLPMVMALRMGVYAPPGGFFDMVFFCHMAINGCRVVREVP